MNDPSQAREIYQTIQVLKERVCRKFRVTCPSASVHGGPSGENGHARKEQSSVVPSASSRPIFATGVGALSGDGAADSGIHKLRVCEKIDFRVFDQGMD